MCHSQAVPGISQGWHPSMMSRRRGSWTTGGWMLLGRPRCKIISIKIFCRMVSPKIFCRMVLPNIFCRLALQTNILEQKFLNWIWISAFVHSRHSWHSSNIKIESSLCHNYCNYGKLCHRHILSWVSSTY